MKLKNPLRVISNSDLSEVKRILTGSPGFLGNPRFNEIGTELHSQVLEKKKSKGFKATKEEKVILNGMIQALKTNLPFQDLLCGAKTEQFYSGEIGGLKFRAALDILNWKKRLIADPKTTSTETYDDFLERCKAYSYFRQAKAYQTLTGIERFIFVGVMKKEPYSVFHVEVNDYPDELRDAKEEMDFLIHFIKVNPWILERVKPNPKYLQP